MAVNDRGHCKYMYMYMFECLSVIKLVTVNGNYYRMRTEDSNKPAYIYISRKHGSFFFLILYFIFYILDPKIASALAEMMSMGFQNDDGWLQCLLQDYNGNIEKVLDIIQSSDGKNYSK